LRYHDIDATFFGRLFLELVGFDVTTSEPFPGGRFERADVIVNLVCKKLSGEIPIWDESHHFFDVLTSKEFAEMHEWQDCEVELVREGHKSRQAYHEIPFLSLLIL
jgi:hypothetical protein